MSYYTGYAVASIAITLALGPLGWIIAIFIIGAAVVAMGYAGKSLGKLIYDAGDSLYSDTILPLTY